jgi:U6 snRNA-associated Sm-like protein LSm5
LFEETSDSKNATRADSTHPENTMASQLLPLELIDKCVGSRIWVIMKNDKGMVDFSLLYLGS